MTSKRFSIFFRIKIDIGHHSPHLKKEGKEVIFTILYEISNSSEIRLTLLGALYILYFLKAFRLLIIPEHQLVSHHRSKFLSMNKQVMRPAHYQNRLEQETRIPFQPPWPHLDASNEFKNYKKTEFIPAFNELD